MSRSPTTADRVNVPEYQLSAITTTCFAARDFSVSVISVFESHFERRLYFASTGSQYLRSVVSSNHP